MRKYLILGVFLAIMMSTTVYAKTTITLNDTVASIGNGGSSWDENNYDMPVISVEIEDAYKRAGKTEEIMLELEGAYWTQGKNGNFSLEELENLTSGAIAIKPINSISVQLNVDIPSNLTSEQKVGFTLPLWITTNDDADVVSVVIRGEGDSQLVGEERCVVAAKYFIRTTYKVDNVPEIKGKDKDELGDISFTEISPQTLSGQTFEVQLNLENSGYIFGDLAYDTKSEHDDDIDYILNPDQYVVFKDGFKDIHPQIKLKRRKKTQSELIFSITGIDALDIGKITLTHLPIVNVNSDIAEGPIEVMLTSDAVLGLPQKVVMAQKVTMTAEEKAEKELAEMIQEDVKEQEEKEQADFKVTFPLGAAYYMKGQMKYPMSGYTFSDGKGHIMVPLRYAAIALGGEEKDISYTKGIVHLCYAGKSIEIRTENKTVAIDGKESGKISDILMREGRVYIPIGEVAKLLGVNKQWDSTQKAAIFG